MVDSRRHCFVSSASAVVVAPIISGGAIWYTELNE